MNESPNHEAPSRARYRKVCKELLVVIYSFRPNYMCDRPYLTLPKVYINWYCCRPTSLFLLESSIIPDQAYR